MGQAATLQILSFTHPPIHCSLCVPSVLGGYILTEYCFFSTRIDNTKTYKVTLQVTGCETIAMETVDRLTIANQLALNLKKNNIKATVVNFGVGGFQSSLESIKFQDLLRRVDKRERPDIVIFYDGFNDAGQAFVFEAGTMQEDLSKKMEALVTGNYGKLAIYSILNP